MFDGGRLCDKSREPADILKKKEGNMNIQRIVGLVLLVGGIILIVVGATASRSFADQVSNFFTGHFSETTLWYIIGGIAAAIVGLVLLVGRFRRN
jgi:LPXTG-motif cell wall-anchored protein